jgi:hypothetical protein
MNLQTGFFENFFKKVVQTNLTFGVQESKQLFLRNKNTEKADFVNICAVSCPTAIFF